MVPGDWNRGNAYEFRPYGIWNVYHSIADIYIYVCITFSSDNEEPPLIAPYGGSSNTISIPHILYMSYLVMSIFINHYQKYSYGNTIYVSYYHIKTLAKWCKIGVNSNL